MAITQAVAASFKKELLDGVHDLDSGGGVFKLALYDSGATINAATTSYTSDREVAASGALCCSRRRVSWSSNCTDSNNSVCNIYRPVLDWCNYHGKRCINI